MRSGSLCRPTTASLWHPRKTFSEHFSPSDTTNVQRSLHFSICHDWYETWTVLFKKNKPSCLHCYSPLALLNPSINTKCPVFVMFFVIDRFNTTSFDFSLVIESIPLCSLSPLAISLPLLNTNKLSLLILFPRLFLFSFPFSRIIKNIRDDSSSFFFLCSGTQFVYKFSVWISSSMHYFFLQFESN